MLSTDSILIVDDDVFYRDNLAHALINEGYLVTAVGASGETFHCGQANPYDLILLDLSLNGTPGFNLLDEFRKDQGQVRFIIITKNATLESAIQAIRQGAEDYMVKPVDLNELIERINQVFVNIRQQKRRSDIEDQIRQLVQKLGEGSNQTSPDSPSNESLQVTIKGTGPVLQRGPFVLHLQGRQVFLEGRLIHLSPTGFECLVMLLRRAPERVSYEEMIREMHGTTNIAVHEARNIIRWQVFQLRQALEADPANPRYLMTERGFGYRLLIHSN